VYSQDSTENRISSEYVDSITARLNGGVRSIMIEREASEVKGLRGKLEASGAPCLQLSSATSPI
jgi:hypothetical protein